MYKTLAMKEVFHNDYADFWLDNGILFFVYQPQTVLNLDIVEQVVADRLRYQEEKSYPVFCDARGITKVDKAARDFLAIEGSAQATAVALLVNPPLNEALSIFYLRTSQPVIPTEMFTDKEKALVYLERLI